MRFRRVTWVAITLVTAAVAGVLAVGAEAYADQGATRCAPPAQTVTAQRPARHDGSWQSRAFRAAPCHAWRTMHRHGRPHGST
jgi:hypothetical protein